MNAAFFRRTFVTEPEVRTTMQLTVADPAVDHVDLVLEAWSAAPAAQLAPASEPSDVAQVEEFVAQLSLRLEDGQIPLWDARA